MKLKQKIKVGFLVIAWSIPLFLAGSGVGMTIHKNRLSEEANWAMNNPKEARWAMNRQILFKKASEELFFDDQDKGITIVKPYVKEVE